MIKILVFSPDRNDFTSYCRAAGPFNRMCRDYPNDIRVQYATDEESSWTGIQSADVCFVQRPHVKEHLELCKKIILSGRKLWIDFDDDFYNVPLANDGYTHFSDPEVTTIINKCIVMADLVTVSTDNLKEKYGKFVSPGKECLTILNGYDSTLFNYHKQEFGPRQKILWMRGSKTHDEDVHVFADQISEWLKANQDYKFVCYGFVPWRILSQIPKDQWGMRKLPMVNYFYDSYMLRPEIMVVPLADNEFNRGKSNVAAIEGAMVGSVVVVPHFLPEFNKLPGVIGYKNSGEDLKIALNTAAMINPSNTLRDHILFNLELGTLNEIRMNALSRLTKSFDFTSEQVHTKSEGQSLPDGLTDDEVRSSLSSLLSSRYTKKWTKEQHDNVLDYLKKVSDCMTENREVDAPDLIQPTVTSPKKVMETIEEAIKNGTFWASPMSTPQSEEPQSQPSPPSP